MVQIGKENSLEVLKQVDFGLYLDGGEEFDEILLPRRYVPETWDIGENLEVFLYLDSEDRPIATTEVPLIQVGQCAYLRVTDTGKFGAFLDWGLTKDLLVPFVEQRIPMQIDRGYVVYAYLDKSGRIAASSKLSSYLDEESHGRFEPGEEVELLIASRTDMGYKAVINGTHLGLVHNTEILTPIRIGQTLRGYIHSVRPDKRINLTFHPKSKEKRAELTVDIIDYLENHHGVCSVTDKSSPDQIKTLFACSKSSFKKALGKLYKERKIKIEKDRIVLL